MKIEKQEKKKSLPTALLEEILYDVCLSTLIQSSNLSVLS